MLLWTVTELLKLVKALGEFRLCTERANKMSYFEINDVHYRTEQALILDLGFPGVHSDEDHQR
jgi:hypothetical protein